jgi:hypothetical protein
MSNLSRFEAHQVFNQAPLCENVDLFTTERRSLTPSSVNRRIKVPALALRAIPPPRRLDVHFCVAESKAVRNGR